MQPVEKTGTQIPIHSEKKQGVPFVNVLVVGKATEGSYFVVRQNRIFVLWENRPLVEGTILRVNRNRLRETDTHGKELPTSNNFNLQERAEYQAVYQALQRANIPLTAQNVRALHARITMKEDPIIRSNVSLLEKNQEKAFLQDSPLQALFFSGQEQRLEAYSDDQSSDGPINQKEILEELRFVPLKISFENETVNLLSHFRIRKMNPKVLSWGFFSKGECRVAFNFENNEFSKLRVYSELPISKETSFAKLLKNTFPNLKISFYPWEAFDGVGLKPVPRTALGVDHHA